MRRALNILLNATYLKISLEKLLKTMIFLNKIDSLAPIVVQLYQ